MKQCKYKENAMKLFGIRMNELAHYGYESKDEEWKNECFAKMCALTCFMVDLFDETMFDSIHKIYSECVDYLDLGIKTEEEGGKE